MYVVCASTLWCVCNGARALLMRGSSDMTCRTIRHRRHRAMQGARDARVPPPRAEERQSRRRRRCQSAFRSASRHGSRRWGRCEHAQVGRGAAHTGHRGVAVVQTRRGAVAAPTRAPGEAARRAPSMMRASSLKKHTRGGVPDAELRTHTCPHTHAVTTVTRPLPSCPLSLRWAARA